MASDSVRNWPSCTARCPDHDGPRLGWPSVLKLLDSPESQDLEHPGNGVRARVGRMSIESRVVPSVVPSELTPGQVAAEFRARLTAGMPLRPAGSARRDPLKLLSCGYTPRYKVELFDTTYYLTRVRQNSDIRFFVAYVVQRNASRLTRSFVKPRRPQ